MVLLILILIFIEYSFLNTTFFFDIIHSFLDHKTNECGGIFSKFTPNQENFARTMTNKSNAGSNYDGELGDKLNPYYNEYYRPDTLQNSQILQDIMLRLNSLENSPDSTSVRLAQYRSNFRRADITNSNLINAKI